MKILFKPKFSPACTAFGQTKGMWLTVFRGRVGKRKIYREFGKAKARAKVIRKIIEQETVV